MTTPPLTPDRPVFTGEKDGKPMEWQAAGGDVLSIASLHRHRTQSGKTYTHGHEGFRTPHLHERDLDVNDPR